MPTGYRRHIREGQVVGVRGDGKRESRKKEKQKGRLKVEKNTLTETLREICKLEPSDFRGLRAAIIYASYHRAGRKPLTTIDIARKSRIPMTTVSKGLHIMAKANLLRLTSENTWDLPLGYKND